MLDCKESSFLVKQDVQILHGDNFGGQLAFCKALFAKCSYGLYKQWSLFSELQNLHILDFIIFLIFFLSSELTNFL